MYPLLRINETRVARRLRAVLCVIFFLVVLTPAGAQTLESGGILYKKVTSTSELNSSSYEYVLVCESTNNVMTDVSNNKGQVGSCTLKEGLLTQFGTTTTPVALTISKSGDYFIIKSGSKYLYLNSSNLTLATNKESKLDISFDAEGNAKIGHYKDSKYISLNNGQLGYYDTYGDNTYKAVQLYRKVYPITFPEVTQGLTTFYNKNYGYELPGSITAYAVTATEKDQPVSITEAFKSGLYIQQGTALLLKGTPGTKLYLPTRSVATATFNGTNLLEGGRTADGYTAASQAGEYYYYKLAIKDDQLGFYWGAENGAAFQMTKPTTAYLAVPKSAVQQASGLRIDLDAITGVQSVEVQDGKGGDGQIYTLDGRRCTTVPRKGMYIINGKKVIR